ncbi:RNA-binding protein 25 [Armadillidium vulgare]|nr:RNA-binding protein 25 [Armadillidium vulgare]
MAFPPRPPLMPGVPVPAMVGTQFTITTNLVRIPAMTQSISSIPTPLTNRPHIRTIAPLPPRPPISANAIINKPPTFSQRIESIGPAVTVFVGNITERAPDIMIRHILNACGPVLSWKRVQGASGKLQGFGFCEYGNPDAALRAIRILHGYEIATNRLVVKADSKTTEVLDDYKEKRKKAQNGNESSSPLQDEKKDDEEEDPLAYMDDAMKAEDRNCIERIVLILSDHKKDIVNYIPPQSKQDVRDKRMNKVQEKLVALSSGADIASIPSTLNLDDMDDVEEGKRELISREITMFRETMKKQEEEKERERKLREKDRERDKERSKERDRDRDRDRDRERDRDRDRDREKERDRREREERRRKSRSTSRSASMARKNSRSPSADTRYSRKEKHHSRSRSHSPSRKSEKELLRERERDAEEKERKEQERKVRKKEMQYQERLKNWEAREHKKQKELDRECEKEKLREIEREKEARRLKEFLEDYDDERDDHKYYKGHAFQRKLIEREHEKEMDTKDRVKEREELEELKAKILSEGHENPEEAYEQARQEREEQYKPKLLLKPPEKPAPVSEPTSRPSSPQSQLPQIASPPQEPSDTNNTKESESEGDDSPPHSDEQPVILPPDENSLSRDAFSSAETTPQAPKRKKLDVKDVFNQDDDETPAKKKKLPLPGKEKSSKEKGGEEKRKHIKSLIDKIPTSKAELFAYPIDASLVDRGLMEKRIRPWINKKIIEYIGEPEPTLVDFICTKVLVGSEPQSLLNDVQMCNSTFVFKFVKY